MKKTSKKEKHSSVCDKCHQPWSSPYLSDIGDWIADADLPDADTGDVRIRCRNCHDEGWLWLRLRVETIEP